jgi:hypothetical protein
MAHRPIDKLKVLNSLLYRADTILYVLIAASTGLASLQSEKQN